MFLTRSLRLISTIKDCSTSLKCKSSINIQCILVKFPSFYSNLLLKMHPTDDFGKVNTNNSPQLVLLALNSEAYLGTYMTMQLFKLQWKVTSLFIYPKVAQLRWMKFDLGQKQDLIFKCLTRYWMSLTTNSKFHQTFASYSFFIIASSSIYIILSCLSVNKKVFVPL